MGDFAVAVGNPFGLGQTATSGIVSALGRSGLNLEGLENFIQTDASINRGNSGGALLNLNGELIGINTAILAPGGGSIGIGFAIPSNMARTLAQQLMQFGEIKRGLLGIKGTEMTSDIAKEVKLDVQRGAFVSEVLPNSGSAKAGVKSGDVITSLNGKPLNSFAVLRSRIATTEPGTKVKLGLLRNGKPLEVEVTLDTSTSSSASAEMIAPALQGATLSDGQLKDVLKASELITLKKQPCRTGRGICIKMTLLLALSAIAYSLLKCVKCWKRNRQSLPGRWCAVTRVFTCSCVNEVCNRTSAPRVMSGKLVICCSRSLY